MIRIENFDRDNYENLIAWVDSEETLMQFAGPAFTFPLTPEQLDIALGDQDRSAFRIVSDETNLIIGYSEIYITGNCAKLGRILIGDKKQRGKGLGQQILKLLLAFVFSMPGITKAELNVFDWNASAIRCYEKVGFTINPNKKLERKINDNVWIALNMVLDKEKWNEIGLAETNFNKSLPC